MKKFTIPHGFPYNPNGELPQNMHSPQDTFTPLHHLCFPKISIISVSFNVLHYTICNSRAKLYNHKIITSTYQYLCAFEGSHDFMCYKYTHVNSVSFICQCVPIFPHSSWTSPRILSLPLRLPP